MYLNGLLIRWTLDRGGVYWPSFCSTRPVVPCAVGELQGAGVRTSIGSTACRSKITVTGCRKKPACNADLSPTRSTDWQLFRYECGPCRPRYFDRLSLKAHRAETTEADQPLAMLRSGIDAAVRSGGASTGRNRMNSRVAPFATRIGWATSEPNSR